MLFDFVDAMGKTPLHIILDFYFVWIIVVFILKFMCKNRKAISLSIIMIIILVIGSIAGALKLAISGQIYGYIIAWCPIIMIIILAPEIRKALDGVWKLSNKGEVLASSNEQTKKAIADAAEHLSLRKIGALITIEKYNSLDQYAEKAIQMNSDVSKEVLINIFSPLTPLHDGAVIIRGDKIRCAGAYYVLTETNNFDKTMGSRHRAALGISEVSDSLTVVVSEETGSISITLEGIMLKVSDKEKLLEYIDMFMK